MKMFQNQRELVVAQHECLKAMRSLTLKCCYVFHPYLRKERMKFDVIGEGEP